MTMTQNSNYKIEPMTWVNYYEIVSDYSLYVWKVYSSDGIVIATIAVNARSVEEARFILSTHYLWDNLQSIDTENLAEVAIAGEPLIYKQPVAIVL